MDTTLISKSLAGRLVCPRDHTEFREQGRWLTCAQGHQYPVIQGVPVLLLDNVLQTLDVADDSLSLSREANHDPWFIETVGCSADEKEQMRRFRSTATAQAVDPVVQFVVAATNGLFYKPLLGKLTSYPIPEIPIPQGDNKPLLDVGCNWGRWSIAAARKGYEVIGLDPSLGSVLAAKRVAQRLGVSASFVVGDARYLPFAQGTFARVFSYSVLQHFSKEDAISSLREIYRVLKPGGESIIQMANALGLRSLQHQIRRSFRAPRNFEVRYWSPWELRRKFIDQIGPTSLTVDGFLGLGVQVSDINIMPPAYRLVIRTSEYLRKLSKWVPITGFADSVCVLSRKRHIEIRA